MPTGLAPNNPVDRVERSDRDSLDLIEADLVAPAVIELRRARTGVVGHGCCVFECAAILQVGGDAGGAEGVVANLRRYAGRRGAALDHGIGIGLGQGSARQLPRTAAYRPEERPLRILGDAGTVQIGV
jgi:hypothetical protein